MEKSDSELLTVMKEFDEYVKDFTTSASMGVPPLDITIDELFGMSREDLLQYNSQTCLSYAFKISGYAMYVRAQINENKARLEWCEDTLNRILGREWNEYDQYMKYDMKRQLIIQNNSFAKKVEELRVVLQARMTLLEDKLKDVRDMSEILTELGKRKAYNERS